MNEVIPGVVDAVAAAEGVEPSELDYSLYDYVETEAIELLSSRSESSWTLTFEVPNHEVTVTDDGRVIVDDKLAEQPA